MAYDFLPGETANLNVNKTTSGGVFKAGKNIFIDKYQDHLDAHKVYSQPAKKSEFKVDANYSKYINTYFSEQKIKESIEDGFYGPNTDYDTLISGYTQFQDPKLLNSSLNKVKDKIPNDLFSGLEKPKINFNDRFGIFSFDLASMMMTYVYEYFTKQGKKVDANYVEYINDQFIFTPSNQIVDQKIKRREDGTPVVVSSVKKSYIDFQKQEKKDRSVEIMINSSFSFYEKATDIIYNSLAGISVAENLIKRGFKVKLTGLFTGKSKGVNYFSFIPVKRFNQPLDKNAAAYVCGDPRYFRFQFFKLMIHAVDQNKKQVQEGIAYAITDKNQIANTIETKYVPNSDRKQADTRLYFGGARNMNDVKQEVDEALTILNKKYGDKEN